jgi:hypothetical protein
MTYAEGGRSGACSSGWRMSDTAVWIYSVHKNHKSTLTFGCRRYFRLVAVPVAAVPFVGGSSCFPLPSIADSSPLGLRPSVLVVLCNAMGKGISRVLPRNSAIALWIFCQQISLCPVWCIALGECRILPFCDQA